ncbi:MAG: 8-amino-7-oxononanoate synthase [Sandaracinaceae bacterium]|nr:8-amino-7-oxononanoate synthase [Sandaracinaceae bacterium]
MLSFREHVRERLEELKAASLLRDPLLSEAQGSTHVVVGGKRLLNFASNDYLGFSQDSGIRKALEEAAKQWGGAASSRLLSGTLLPHRKAESLLAAFVGHEDARLFSSGYAANLGAISALVGPGDALFSDALNHASIIDGCRLSRAKVLVYRHKDMGHLEELLAENRQSFRAALIVSDGVFSMDGDIAPLSELRRLADRYEAGLLIDEAHALGVLGPEGRGLCASLGVQADVITGMLGKAFGLAGGFVASDAMTIRLIENRARSYVFSTALHPALALAAIHALEQLRQAEEARKRLREFRSLVWSALPPPLQARIQAHPHVPIVPIVIGEVQKTLRFAKALNEEGIFAPAIRPPTVPEGSARIRISLSAAHDPKEIEWASQILRKNCVELI